VELAGTAALVLCACAPLWCALAICARRAVLQRLHARADVKKRAAAAGAAAPRPDEDARTWAAALRAVGAGGDGGGLGDGGAPGGAPAADDVWAPPRVEGEYQGSPRLAGPPVDSLGGGGGGSGAPSPAAPRAPPAAVRHARVPTTFEGLLRALTPFEPDYYAPPRAGTAPGHEGMAVDVVARR